MELTIVKNLIDEYVLSKLRYLLVTFQEGYEVNVINSSNNNIKIFFLLV